jgi:electron transport complex protein RnfB
LIDIYERLRQRLDHLAKGFPATEKGAEINFLKQLFSQEDAELFIAMGDEYETAVEFASRLGADPVVIADKMESMAKRGLLFRLRKNEEVYYRIIPVVHGIWEFNLKNLDAVLVKNFNRAFVGGFGRTLHSTEIPLFRTVPIHTEVVSGNTVLPYDDAASIIKTAKVVSVADCICRKIAEIGGKPCDHIKETCLCFDDMADYYVENGLSRYISTDEALEILKHCEQEGLVFHVSNSKRVEVACCCCSCCCGLLISLNVFGGPSREVLNNYVCEKDDSLCIDCEICLERCPVKSFRLIEDKIQFKQEKCIGCGLCVPVCPTNALSLVKKPEEKIYEPPKELFFDTYTEIQKVRNRL